MKPWHLNLKDDSLLLNSLCERADYLLNQVSEEHELTKDFIEFYQVGTKRTGNSLGGFSYANGVISYNVVIPMIEEALAKATQIQTLPALFGKDTKFLERRAARHLNNYIANHFKKSYIYEQGTQTELHSLVNNLGILKIMVNKKENKFEFSSPVLYDIGFENPYDGRVFDRKEIVEVNEYSCYEIIEMFPHLESDIKKIHLAESKRNDEKIKVYQIWYSKKACCTFTKKIILEKKEITLEHPYVFKARTRPCVGMIGKGLSQRLRGYQHEINRLLKKISIGIDTYSFPYIFAHVSSGVSKMINNQPGNIYTYKNNTPPSIHPAPKVSDEVINMLFRTIEQAFKEARLDINSVGGDPFGSVRSGTGLQKKVDLERSGHYNTLKDYERMFMKMAGKMLKYGKQYGIGEPDFWEDYENLDEILYKLQKYPMDLSSRSPREKMATAEAIVSSGFYSPEEIVSFMDFPDHSVLFTSKLERIHAIYRIVEEAMLDKVFIEPDPALGYFEQKDVAMKTYSTLIKEGIDYDDERLLILDNFLATIKREMDIIKQREVQQMLQQNPPATTEAPLTASGGGSQLATGDKISSELAREEGGSQNGAEELPAPPES